MSDFNAMVSAIGQIRTMSVQAAASGGHEDSDAVSFAAVLQDAIGSISARQALAASDAQAFELGAPGASLSDMVVDGAQANIAFQRGLTVRNRLVDAYTTIMHIDL